MGAVVKWNTQHQQDSKLAKWHDAQTIRFPRRFVFFLRFLLPQVGPANNFNLPE